MSDRSRQVQEQGATWNVAHETPLFDYKSLSSYTWKCPTKIFLDPCEVFGKGGHKVLLSFVQLLRSPDGARQQVFVGPLLLGRRVDGRWLDTRRGSLGAVPNARGEQVQSAGTHWLSVGNLKIFLWVFSLFLLVLFPAFLGFPVRCGRSALGVSP